MLVDGFGVDICLFSPLVSGFPGGLCVRIVSTACSRRMFIKIEIRCDAAGVHSGVCPLAFVFPRIGVP